MEETLKAIQKQLQDLAATNADVVARLSNLEDEKVAEDKDKDAMDKKPLAGGLEELQTETEGLKRGQHLLTPRHYNPGREKSLSLTFGEDCSARALRLFIDHYELAASQNRDRGIDGWEDDVFRARELRLQLRGEAALWLSHESAMGSSWTDHDEEIILRLRQRYLETQSLELSIVMFEELGQNEDETLASYMTRCQEKGMEAFAQLNEPRSTQQRIVWKFLSGIRDAAVRSEVIKQKWMRDSHNAKTYEEVLLIAEQAQLDRLAAAATGKQGGGQKETFRAGAVGRVKERRKAATYRTNYNSGDSSVSSTPSPSPKSGRSSRGSTGSGGSLPTSTKSEEGNFLCHFCKTRSHFGGWKVCPKRSTEDRDWRPQGFQ